MGRPFQLGSVSVFVGCSIGIANAGAEAHTPQDLLRLADLAMYKSKQDGRNRVTPYSVDLSAKAIERENVIARIRTAFKEKQFRLYYQPIVDLQTLKPAGAEALLRIQCPNEGLLPPAEIIRTAEETGMIAQVGEWVVEEGCATGQNWLNAGWPEYLSINLSPKQFDPMFMASLILKLQRIGDVASKLVFEITESTLMDNPECVADFFAEIRATGARIAIDDFGTGYSSLNFIGRFPVDFVKLDRSFVRHIGDSENATAQRNLALIKATATLCHELGIAVVAEGIETAVELEKLRSIGINYGQGYLFSPALPETQYRAWATAFGNHVRPSSRLVKSAC